MLRILLDHGCDPTLTDYVSGIIMKMFRIRTHHRQCHASVCDDRLADDTKQCVDDCDSMLEERTIEFLEGYALTTDRHCFTTAWKHSRDVRCCSGPSHYA
jgi:hypothetical protein